MNHYSFLNKESAESRKAQVMARRRSDRARRHEAIREHLAEAAACGWVASATLFSLGDFFASAVAKRIEKAKAGK